MSMFVDPSVIESVRESIKDIKQQSSPASISAARKDQLSVSNSADENPLIFTFAQLAIFSPDKVVCGEGVEQLKYLVANGFKPSESAFWLVIGHMEEGNYAEAKKILRSLVQADPANERAAALLEIYKEHVRDNGPKGLFIIGALAFVGVAAVVGLSYWLSNRNDTEVRNIVKSQRLPDTNLIRSRVSKSLFS